MSTCAVVSIDDLLVSWAPWAGMNPLEGQRLLYDALASNHRMVVLSANSDREMVRGWLRQQHYRFDLVQVMEASVAIDVVSWKVQAVRDIRAMGWPVGLYLDSDPEAVRRVFADGTAALLLAHRLSRPQWLPTERNPKPWNELVDFIEKQQERAAAPEPGVPRPWDSSVVP